MKLISCRMEIVAHSDPDEPYLRAIFFSLDEKGIEKVANSIVKIYKDNGYLIQIKSLISDVRERFLFNWKTHLCNIIDRGLK